MKLTVLILLFSATLFGQVQPAERFRDHNANGWFMYFGDHHVSDKWGVHLEGQWRRHDMVNRWQQLLLRPGINYDLTENVMLTLGYAFVDTHRYGEFPVAFRFPEHRIFQQALVRQRLGRTRASHRYRLEQRYLGEMGRAAGGATTVNRWRYENRFRYMFRANIPFRGGRLEKGDWYLGLYNEFFLNFGKNVAANIFDQNRAYAAMGYNMGSLGNLEVGYMQQTLQQRSGRVMEYSHTFQVAVYSNFPFQRR
jgi:hypothetical protein